MLLAFDLEGIAPGGGRDAAKAAADSSTGLDRPTRSAVLSFPNGVNLNFTGDRVRVREALSKIAGRGVSMPPSIYSVGIQEAFQADSGNTFALTRAVDRECARSLREPPCRGLPDRDHAPDAGRGAHLSPACQRGQPHIRGNAAELQAIDAPKTVVWISEGLPMPFGEGQADLGRLSAERRRRARPVRASSGSQFGLRRVGRKAVTECDGGSRLGRQGLDLLAGVSRGTVLSSIGTGTTPSTESRER